MTYKIIGDSCLDLTEELKRDPRFQMVPLTLQVGSAQVVDDETFDQKSFIDMVRPARSAPRRPALRRSVLRRHMRRQKRRLSLW